MSADQHVLSPAEKQLLSSGRQSLQFSPHESLLAAARSGGSAAAAAFEATPEEQHVQLCECTDTNGRTALSGAPALFGWPLFI